MNFKILINLITEIVILYNFIFVYIGDWNNNEMAFSIKISPLYKILVTIQLLMFLVYFLIDFSVIVLLYFINIELKSLNTAISCCFYNLLIVIKKYKVPKIKYLGKSNIYSIIYNCLLFILNTFLVVFVFFRINNCILEYYIVECIYYTSIWSFLLSDFLILTTLIILIINKKKIKSEDKINI